MTFTVSRPVLLSASLGSWPSSFLGNASSLFSGLHFCYDLFEDGVHSGLVGIYFDHHNSWNSLTLSSRRSIICSILIVRNMIIQCNPWSTNSIDLILSNPIIPLLTPLSCDGLTVDGVCIDNWIHWTLKPLVNTLYKSLSHKY
jgi:hypothetical protein